MEMKVRDDVNTLCNDKWVNHGFYTPVMIPRRECLPVRLVDDQ